MYSRISETLNRRSVLRCCSAMLLCAVATTPAWPSCPKLLMASGVLIRKQTNADQAAYWGQTVGVQGFMVNGIMTQWDTDVGTDPNSNLWKLVSQFQSIYSQHGVTDNFIKVGLYSKHDWHNAWQNETAATNFGHAAALAKYAGFKGIAIDLEPYQPTWNAGQELASTVQQEGQSIGKAMHEAYPDMTLILEQDALHNAFEPGKAIAAISNTQAMPPDYSYKRKNGGYQLAVPFLRGLLSVNWSHVVIATEETYKDFDIANVMKQTSQNYATFLGDGAVWSNLSVAPGLWPLGLSQWNKSARLSPEQFTEQLKTAFQVSPDYVWIYGYGSAWQTDGPYGPGPVTANFQQYTNAIHQVRATCGADAPASSPRAQPTAYFAPPRASDEPAHSIGAFRNVDRARSVGSFQPAGTLPRIVPLRAAGRAVEIP